MNFLILWYFHPIFGGVFTYNWMNLGNRDMFMVAFWRAL